MQYIISIGIFQALVAAGLLWKNKLRSSADDLLILLVVCIATHLAIKLVIYTFITDAAVRHQMNTFIGFCYAPLLYLYTLKIRNPAFIPATKWYVFIPFILGAIAYFTVAGVLFVSDASGYVLLNVYNSISFWTLIPVDIIFMLLSINIARRHLAMSKERQIIERIAGSFLFISVLSIGFYFAVNSLGRDYSIIFRSAIYSLLACLCVMIIRYKYVAIAHTGQQVIPETTTTVISPETEYPLMLSLEEPAVEEPEEPVTRKATLPETEQRKIWLTLEQYLKSSSIFADSELNLDKLALATGISKYHISETLNSYAHKSFYQYINEYRIGFALNQMQRLLERSVPVNVLSLAYDAGFKAKSSFNRYFKEITGVTPTEHLKTLQGTTGVANTATEA